MKKTWTYACMYRPPEAGLYPVDGFVSRSFCEGELPDGRKYHGFVHFDRPLTADEVVRYMLVYFGWDGVSD